MSSNDSLASAAEGVTQAGWSIGKDEIKNLVYRFIDKNLYFINDPKTLDEVRKQRKSTEFLTFKDYITDSIHLALVASGIGARNLSEEKYKALIANVKSAHKKKGQQ